jgi:hypothetical protein
MTKNYKIEEKVLNATIQYLASRPYAEVFQLLQALQQSQEVKEEEIKEEKKK